MIVIIFHLTIQTLETFRHFDFARAFNRPHWAGMFTQMTGIAAFGPTLQQINQMQTIQHGQ
jgi:hypothetical protein